jgi:hypothetical protein
LEKIISPVILGYEEIRTQHPNCFDLLTVSIDVEIDNRWQQVYYQKGASCKKDCEWTNGWVRLVYNGDFSKLHLNISEQTLINEIWRLLNTEDINITLPMRYSLRDGNNKVIQGINAPVTFPFSLNIVSPVVETSCADVTVTASSTVPDKYVAFAVSAN